MRSTRARRVVVEASASTANLGPGFDVFGLGLEEPRDRVVVEPCDRVEIVSEAEIPKDPRRNCAGLVALKLVEDFGLPGVRIRIEKGVPIGKGMGSSAASAVATVFGIDRLFGLGLGMNELVEYAAKGELASAGVEHFDNVSASAFGGFVLVLPGRPIRILHADPPKGLGVCLAIPELDMGSMKTGKLRKVIPKSVPLEVAVRNLGRASAIVFAMLTGEIGLLKDAVRDEIVEPARARLIPGYEHVKEEGIKEGALAVALSGAGPTMVAFYDKARADGRRIGEGMRRGFMKAGIKSNILITEVGGGVRLLEER